MLREVPASELPLVLADVIDLEDGGPRPSGELDDSAITLEA